MSEPSVVRVGPLMPFLSDALVREYAAPSLADVGYIGYAVPVAVDCGRNVNRIRPHTGFDANAAVT